MWPSHKHGRVTLNPESTKRYSGERFRSPFAVTSAVQTERGFDSFGDGRRSRRICGRCSGVDVGDHGAFARRTPIVSAAPVTRTGKGTTASFRLQSRGSADCVNCVARVSFAIQGPARPTEGLSSVQTGSQTVAGMIADPRGPDRWRRRERFLVTQSQHPPEPATASSPASLPFG